MTTNLASILRQSAGFAEITLLAGLLMVVKLPPAHRMEPPVLGMTQRDGRNHVPLGAVVEPANAEID